MLEEAIQKKETWVSFPHLTKTLLGQGGLTRSKSSFFSLSISIEVVANFSRVRKRLLKEEYGLSSDYAETSRSVQLLKIRTRFSTGPTLIPVRRQERLTSRRSQRRGRGQPPGSLSSSILFVSAFKGSLWTPLKEAKSSPALLTTHIR